jgi:hypothetical protein
MAAAIECIRVYLFAQAASSANLQDSLDGSLWNSRILIQWRLVISLMITVDLVQLRRRSEIDRSTGFSVTGRGRKGFVTADELLVIPRTLNPNPWQRVVRM